MFETIAALGTAQILTYAGGSTGAFILAWVLKKVPNEQIKKVVGKFFYGLGVSMTLGLSKWKYTKKFWNSQIESWLVDLIDNVIGHGVKEFIRGLRSDNQKSKIQSLPY